MKPEMWFHNKCVAFVLPKYVVFAELCGWVYVTHNGYKTIYNIVVLLLSCYTLRETFIPNSFIVFQMDLCV